MCIILYHPENAQLPDEKRLEEMWEGNDDGAGYMYVKNGEVVVKKGFMKYQSFIKSYRKEKFKQGDIFIIHMRLASKGGIAANLCHPFPLEKEYKKIISRESRTTMAMVHNGTIKIKIPEFCSDSSFIAWRILSDDIIKNNINNESIKILLNNLFDSSRIIILDNKERITMFGRWYYIDECYYSKDKDEWKKKVYINIINGHYDLNTITGKYELFPQESYAESFNKDYNINNNNIINKDNIYNNNINNINNKDNIDNKEYICPICNTGFGNQNNYEGLTFYCSFCETFLTFNEEGKLISEMKL